MKIKKFFNVYVWFILPVLGIITALEEYYPDRIPLNIDIYLGIIVVLVVISMFVSFYSSFKGLFKHLFSDGQRNRILKTGKPTLAKVLKIKESGEEIVTINDQPYVTLEMEVDDSGSKYKTELETIIGRLDIPKFQPGKVFAVKIDPNNRMKIVFDPERTILKNKK